MSAKRPGGLTAICVIAIILGCLSTCGTLYGYAGAAFTPMMQSWQQQQMNAGGFGASPQFDEMQRAQQEMTAEMQRFTLPGLALSTLGALIGLALLIGASLALSGKPVARGLLVMFGVGIAFEVLHAAAGVWLQIQTQELVQRYMGRMMSMSQTPGSPPPPAEIDTIMSATMGASMAIGICFAVGWALAKITYYGWSIAYLRKPEVRAHLSGDQASAGAAGLVA
jgi:hypothetical protein